MRASRKYACDGPRWVCRTITAMAVMATLAGCTTYPMGLTEKQWNALSPAEQAQYRAQQYAIDAERRRVAEERYAQAVREAAERERLERERIQAFHAAGRYGDVITVTIAEGQITFGGKRHAYEPVSFDLVRGERRDVEFTQAGNPYVKSLVTVRLADDGNTFYFDEVARKRIVIVNDGWERGRVYRPHDISRDDGPSGAAGVMIRIKLKELPGAPERVIIKER